MLKQPIYYEFNLDARTSPSKLIAISHVDDKYSEVLEVAVKQNDRFVYMGGATVVARMVLHREKDYLLSDSVPCTVNANGNILIPFDNAVVKTSQGVVKIEVNITRDTDELTLQFPLWVSVTGSILDNAEVTPESEGTIPDLLKDAADALEDATEALEQLGSYSNLEDKPQINGVTLSGNKTSGELGLQKALTAGGNVNIDVNGNITITGIVKYADGADGQAGTNGELAALDSNGALKRSGVTVAQSIGSGAANMLPTTNAVKTALDGKTDKSAAESRLPVAITPHVGLVDSRNLSLYGTASLGNYHTSVLVEEGERYIISCRSSNNVYPGAFYTLNGAKVSSIFEDSATHLNVTITVPSGVDTLWINSKSTIIPLDEWKLYRIASAAEYTEHNNGCIVTLQNEREDEAVESLRRLKNLETLFDFRWKPFDKAYYCFVNDGSKSWMHVIYDVFHAHGVPLTAAVVGENIELANDADTTPGGRTVKQTLDAIVADGGEVMTYLNARRLKSTDPFELWYDYAVKNGKHKIEAYGYRVRGLILSEQSARNSVVGQEICERFFDYSDRVGIKPQFNINRKQFSDTATVEDVKAYIDSTVGTPGFYPILFHRPSQDPWSTAAGMDEVLTYIEGKGSLAAISTYSTVFDEFGTNGFLTLGDLPTTQGVLYGNTSN